MFTRQGLSPANQTTLVLMPCEGRQSGLLTQRGSITLPALETKSSSTLYSPGENDCTGKVPYGDPNSGLFHSPPQQESHFL